MSNNNRGWLAKISAMIKLYYQAWRSLNQFRKAMKHVAKMDADEATPIICEWKSRVEKCQNRIVKREIMELLCEFEAELVEEKQGENQAALAQ